MKAITTTNTTTNSSAKTPIDDISTRTTPGELERLHAENTVRSPKVLLATVVTAETWFQGRNTGLHQDTREAIRDGVTHGHKIPPLLVFGSETQPVIVDGHHRLQVYREMQQSPLQKVAVEWVEGDFEAALAATFRENRAAAKHLSINERTQHAWKYLCVQAARGELFVDDDHEAPEGTFRKTIKDMRETFSLKRRATNNLRAEIKGLLRHLEFDTRRLAEVLQDELRELHEARWWYGVKQKLQDYYDGVCRDPTPDTDFDEEPMVMRMMETWRANMDYGWLTEPKYAGPISQALTRMMSDHTKFVMLEHLVDVVDAETVEAVLEERKDLEGLRIAEDERYPF